MATACKHPKVRIVSRHEDTEFVECLECGEIFDSEEFRDMEIEDTAGTEDSRTIRNEVNRSRTGWIVALALLSREDLFGSGAVGGAGAPLRRETSHA
jgi:hypothetical protein